MGVGGAGVAAVFAPVMEHPAETNFNWIGNAMSPRFQKRV
jgi:hypothetical protein